MGATEIIVIVLAAFVLLGIFFINYLFDRMDHM